MGSALSDEAGQGDLGTQLTELFVPLLHLSPLNLNSVGVVGQEISVLAATSLQGPLVTLLSLLVFQFKASILKDSGKSVANMIFRALTP